MDKKALCIGYCTLDQIGLVEHFARDDEEVEMPTFSLQGGGTAATAAVALARWGSSPTFIGKVGDDDRGDLIVRTLADEGVNTDPVVRAADKISQLQFVVVEAATSRHHSYYTPGNVGPLQPDDVDVSVVDDHDLVVVDGKYCEAQLPVMQRAADAGIPVVFEANQSRQIVERCIEHATVVVASEREASSFTGVGSLEGICQAFLERGPDVAIVTLGDEGAVALGRDTGELVRVDGLDVEVVDKTGVADVFLGGVAQGVLEGWELPKVVEFANRAAGLACTGPGGRSAIADREELVEGTLSVGVR